MHIQTTTLRRGNEMTYGEEHFKSILLSQIKIKPYVLFHVDFVGENGDIMVMNF